MAGDDERVVICSGIGPGYQGVGRLVEYLDSTAPSDVEVHWRWRHRQPVRLLLAQRRLFALVGEYVTRAWATLAWKTGHALRRCRHAKHVVLLHPQSLGIATVLDLIRDRSVTWIYVMDTSFFCRSGYNHREGRECLACLGTDGTPGRAYACPTPLGDADDLQRLSTGLSTFSKTGQVRFLVQNPSQGELVRRHFGPATHVHLVGLWARDWDRSLTGTTIPGGPWDVVFHGSGDPAKGAQWAVELARRLPGIRMFFPFVAPKGSALPADATFLPCSWESGLGKAVADARLVLVPSLWSAPVEGALVKSIRLGRAVAVVHQEGGFTRDLPEGLVLALSQDLDQAADQVRDALMSGWAPPSSLRDAWWESFQQQRHLVDAISRVVRRVS